MSSANILLIDDEVQIRRLLEISLQSNGFNVVEASTAKEGLIAATGNNIDLILLDLGLPDDNGHNVLKQLREWFAKPIIILSVQSNEQDIVQALDNGANDYLIKPFRTGELLARIRSALRAAVSDTGSAVINYGALVFDLQARVVKKDDHILKLTATEYTLLTLLAKNEGKVLTHQYLLRTVWGPTYTDQSQYLRVFIAQLRKKIEDNPNKPQYIVTESGVGYRFVAT